MKPVVVLTLGDFNGVGPEVAIAAALHPGVRKVCTPVLAGPLDLLTQTARHLKKRVRFEKAVFPALPGKGVLVHDVGEGLWADVTFGTPTKASGRTAGQVLERSIELCTSGRADAMVTAPASKHALQLAGYNFPGQTEIVTLLSRSTSVLMMLVSKKLRVGLVTAHMPIAGVAGQISRDKVKEKLRIMESALRNDFGVRSPRIAVLGLNPHAGEEGHLGTEERTAVAPAVETLCEEGMSVDGPFPADGFFGAGRYSSYDGVLAMYHDQGLIPLKLMSFGSAVNFSAGLPIVRTSPDHGTAYDLAGKGTANPKSMVEAVLTAVSIVKKRKAR